MAASHDAAPVVIAGAGPGGLTAAYLLTQRGEHPLVLEADDVVGGISRTVERDGWRFDLGGHRFFTKVDEVETLWHEILPEGDFMLRPRMSRIYYKGKFLDYPLRALNVLRNLSLWEGFMIGLSYLWSRIHPPKDEANYENWLVKRFGWRLYRTFFKTYTEKVWGVPVSDMPADWAAQRVKNLDLRKAVVNAILPKRGQTDITTLIEEFQYPKYGPGMMWEVCAEKVKAAGGTVEMEARLTRINVERGRRGQRDLHPGGRRAHRARLARDLDHADARAGEHDHARPAARGGGGGRRPALPRLPHRGAGRARGAQLPRQLDLHPRHRRRGRPHPELRVVVALSRQGRADLPRPRVLRLRGRRHVEQARRRARSRWAPRS